MSSPLFTPCLSGDIEAGTSPFNWSTIVITYTVSASDAHASLTGSGSKTFTRVAYKDWAAGDNFAITRNGCCGCWTFWTPTNVLDVLLSYACTPTVGSPCTATNTMHVSFEQSGINCDDPDNPVLGNVVLLATGSDPHCLGIGCTSFSTINTSSNGINAPTSGINYSESTTVGSCITTFSFVIS